MHRRYGFDHTTTSSPSTSSAVAKRAESRRSWSSSACSAARNRFVLGVVSDKGKGGAHGRGIFHGHVQHQTDPVRMCATPVSGFEGEAPDPVEDRLVLDVGA